MKLVIRSYCAFEVDKNPGNWKKRFIRLAETFCSPLAHKLIISPPEDLLNLLFTHGWAKIGDKQGWTWGREAGRIGRRRTNPRGPRRDHSWIAGSGQECGVMLVGCECGEWQRPTGPQVQRLEQKNEDDLKLHTVSHWQSCQLSNRLTTNPLNGRPVAPATPELASCCWSSAAWV